MEEELDYTLINHNLFLNTPKLTKICTTLQVCKLSINIIRQGLVCVVSSRIILLSGISGHGADSPDSHWDSIIKLPIAHSVTN